MIDTNPVSQTLCVGIDLGTTNSLIAFWKDGQAHLIPNALGNTLTPSAVSVLDDGSLVVGQTAKDRLLTHPELSVSVFKRLMGTTKTIELGEHTFHPEDLSALVLRSLVADAKAFLGIPITDAIISVPAYFNDTQRKATHAAARIAGLNVLRLINEPTAAALAYGLHRASTETKFLVFDLGGGTLDVSVVELFEGVIEVKASTGDNQLGGEDFTKIIAGMLREQWLNQRSVANIVAGVSNDLDALGQTIQSFSAVAFFQSQAERGKLELTQTDTVSWETSFEGFSLMFELTQGGFEKHAQTLLERLRKPVERALRDAKLRVSDMDDIVLVGGASRMPIVRRLLARILGRELKTQIHPDEAIALGTAVQAGLAAQDLALADVMMTDVCPYSLGIEVSETISQTERLDGLFSPIIERNTLIPASRSSSYLPQIDFQTQMIFNIYQGEARLVKDNILLGELDIKIPKRPRGELSADVRFSYDMSGLLEIDVTLLPDGIKHKLTLLGQASHLSDADVLQRSARLATLKIDPREDAPNRALIARLERMYGEYLADKREAVAQAHKQFLSVLSSQNPQLINRSRKQIAHWCDGVEQDNSWNINPWGENGDAKGDADET